MANNVKLFSIIADRAKQIQNFAKINIDNTEKIIRDLKEENEKLKKMLEKEHLSSLSTSSQSFYGFLIDNF